MNFGGFRPEAAVSEMTEVLKIEDLHNGTLAFDLSELLPLVEDVGPSLSWRVFPMGASTELHSYDGAISASVVELANKVDNSQDGVDISWSDLLALSNIVDQTDWGTFIACRSSSQFSGLSAHFAADWMYVDRALPAFYANVEVAFQAVDSSFWLVYLTSEDVLRRARNRFQHVEQIVV